ncbi:MAG: polyhydroxyalkanoate synthesis repressor PhaR [Rhodospirillaceae bacterium]|nr:polyhydroxyalkanoate synthesis repressor PhaR [Rhodospirillaceae bacterium]MCA8933098.1 polyhydroxyalkanoate synthesis repressor PhaR [Rhodospirillaceae bacterium]
MATEKPTQAVPVTIKKYANRRLYNTSTSSYVTLDHLSHMVKDGVEFAVYDAKSGENITRSVLTQIIVEEENKGQNMLPIGFLRQLISMYGDSMQWMVPNYLEYSMQAFAKNQEKMRQYFQQTMAGMFPFGTLEEMSKQQLAMAERAMKMFSPFPENPVQSATERLSGNERESAEGDAPVSFAAAAEAQVELLQARLQQLQGELAAVNKAKKAKADAGEADKG